MSETNGMTPPESAGQWLTVAEAVGLLKRSDKTVRRMIERGDLEGELSTTERGREWRIKAASVYAHISLHVTEGDGRQRRNLTEPNGSPLDRKDSVTEGKTESDSNYVPEGDGRVTEAMTEPQNSQIEAVAGEVHQLRGEIENLKAFIAGGAMQALNERLATLPDAEAMRAALAENQEQTAQIVAQSIEKALEASAAQQQEREAQRETQREARMASKDDVKAILEELKRVQDTNARLSSELEQLHENQQQKRGFFGRLFGGG